VPSCGEPLLAALRDPSAARIVSAVLRDLGWDWVKGYEPRGNY
jgi:hypothetical protein